jgi:nitric oxide reductase large subunit
MQRFSNCSAILSRTALHVESFADQLHFCQDVLDAQEAERLEAARKEEADRLKAEQEAELLRKRLQAQQEALRLQVCSNSQVAASHESFAIFHQFSLDFFLSPL